MEKCFACGKTIRANGQFADTLEDQRVIVGPDCFRRILKAGRDGYQPPLGGPKLFRLTPEREEYFAKRI